MDSILKKLTQDEIKQLSKEMNKIQKEFFGNSLSLRKQENLMSKLFKTKNWSTLLGTTSKEKSHEYDKKSEYQKTVIEVEILSNGYYSEPLDLKTIDHDINFGDCSGSIKVKSRDSLDVNKIATALEEQGSDPNFLISLSQEKEEMIDDIIFEIDRLLKYNYKFEDSTHDQKIDLILDYHKQYIIGTTLFKAEVVKYLEDGDY